jgi:allantoinase
LISEARRRGVDVSCETCPHYLALTAADVEKIGPTAKCAPPLRSGKEQERLWQQLLAGELTTVGSDHSPCPPDLKENANFFEVWGGISGAQHTLSIMLTEAHFTRGASLSLVSSLLSGNVAKRFKLPETKGRIAVGADADFVLVSLNRSLDVQEEDLYYRHPQTPYMGRRLHGRIVRTILRGRTVFNDGDIVAQRPGRLVRPVK